ncbi:MAG: polysaccharide biosynthesis tyrosine autokinase [Solirubrobacterales bacterium]
MPPTRQPEDSDLSLIAQVIRRRIWVVLLCFVVSTAAAVALSVRAEKQYEATTALLLRSSSAFEPQRAVDTNLQLLGLPAVARATAQRLGDIGADEIAGSIEASQEGDADILEVTATSSSPEQAALIANTYAEEFLAFRTDSERERLQTSQIEVIEPASPPSSPVSPKPVRNTVFGALIGLVLGIGLALLLEQLDRRVKRQEDVAEATGLPLLASVPKRRAFDREHLGHASLSPAETEVFRLLRANLRYFKAQQDVKSVVVTSAAPGEGKTLVSLGLALAAVTSGERVLLIEADLRDPGLSRVLNLEASGGLSWVLTEDYGSVADAVTQVRASELADAVGDTMLDVIPAGAIPPNPTELVESQRMGEVLAFAEGAYDFIVIDTPPVLVVSDAIPLIMASSGVLAVSGIGVSTRSSATDLAVQLDRLGASTLGLVANFVEHAGRSYDGYGYGRPPDMDLMRKSASKPAGPSDGDQ